MWLMDRMGFGKVMVLGMLTTHIATSVPYLTNASHLSIGSVAQIIGYSLEAPAPPFPVFVLGYAVNGFGLSLQVRPNRNSAFRSLYTIMTHLPSFQDAGANGFVACLKDNTSSKMSILHAVYGPYWAPRFYHQAIG